MNINTARNERLARLKQQIAYEKKRMQCCAYGRKDLLYLASLEQELEDLENEDE